MMDWQTEGILTCRKNNVISKLIPFTLDEIIKWKHFLLLALCEGNPPATGGSPSQRPVTRSFDIFFDLCLNEWLSKQLRRQWF